MYGSLFKLWHWFPPVGVFIAILALLGVLVPLFRDITKIGKKELAFWTFILFALVMLEIRSIYLDRNEHDRKEAEARQVQLEGFRTIGESIKASIEKSDQQFSTTIARIDKNISTVTGGDTYCVVLASYIGTGFLMVANSHGNSPLHEVEVDLVDMDRERTVKDFTYEAIQGFTTHLRIPFLAPTRERAGQMLTTVPVGNVNARNFHFSFYSMNGTWGEFLSLRLVNGQWIQAIKVSKEWKPNQQKILYELIPENFPKVNGKVDW